MNREADLLVAARGADLPTTGPVPVVADDRPGEPSPDRRRSPSAADRATAAEVLAQTGLRWCSDSDGLIRPNHDWLRCGVCGNRAVIRYWQFHVRPGRPTIPWRCDVAVKCTGCAAGWWHGVAVPIEWWLRRPRPDGLRALLLRGSCFEPKLWNGDRGGRDRG